MFREAARVQAELAAGNERATRRVELLRLRFQDVLPIRDIAGRWKDDAARLHHEYATTREEFRAALQRVMTFHMPAATAAHGRCGLPRFARPPRERPFPGTLGNPGE